MIKDGGNYYYDHYYDAFSKNLFFINLDIIGVIITADKKEGDDFQTEND